MKKSSRSAFRFAVPAGLAIAALGFGVAAHASKDTAKKVNAAKFTCEEFLALGTETQPRVVYWLEGVSNSGKPEAAEVDVGTLERPVSMIVTECRQTPKATLWDKVKQHL